MLYLFRCHGRLALTWPFTLVWALNTKHRSIGLAVFYDSLCLDHVLWRPSSCPCSVSAFILTMFFVSLRLARVLCQPSSGPCSLSAFVLTVFCVSLRPGQVLCRPLSWRCSSLYQSSFWPCSMSAFVLAVFLVSLRLGRVLCQSLSWPFSLSFCVLPVFCVSLHSSAWQTQLFECALSRELPYRICTTVPFLSAE